MGPLLVSLVLSSITHTRLETAAGPVHVLEVGEPKWTVLYVHGYRTDVDTAWREHRLEAQLVASGLEAVFIVPEAPSGPGQRVFWPKLEALLSVVEGARSANLPRQVIALGHSGAYRTLASWTDFERLQTLVLLDAFYTTSTTWSAWLARDPARHLFVLSKSTAARAARFCASDTPRVECRETRATHMGLITEGEALPHYVRRAAEVTAQPTASLP